MCSYHFHSHRTCLVCFTDKATLWAFFLGMQQYLCSCRYWGSVVQGATCGYQAILACECYKLMSPPLAMIRDPNHIQLPDLCPPWATHTRAAPEGCALNTPFNTTLEIMLSKLRTVQS